jgi:hypothetical protein
MVKLVVFNAYKKYYFKAFRYNTKYVARLHINSEKKMPDFTCTIFVIAVKGRHWSNYI